MHVLGDEGAARILGDVDAIVQANQAPSCHVFIMRGQSMVT